MVRYIKNLLFPNDSSYFIAFCLILVMTTSTPEKQDGLKALNDAIVKIKETITSLGGVFQIQMPVSF